MTVPAETLNLPRKTNISPIPATKVTLEALFQIISIASLAAEQKLLPVKAI